jgi:sugar lactone lactonase YvrE
VRKLLLPAITICMLFPLATARAQQLAIQRIAGKPIPPVSDGTAAQSALFGMPAGVAVDARQQMYVSDSAHGRVYRIDTSGKVATLAAIAAPGRLAVDRESAVYVIDSFVFVQKITPDGKVTRYAGSGAMADSADGKPAVQTSFRGLTDLAFDPAGRLCVVDQYAYKIRRIETDGTVKTIAGTGEYGISGDGGPATSAKLANPNGIAFLPSGEMLIADYVSSQIRKVSNGTISTFAGTKAPAGALNTGLYYPNSLAVSPAGDIYFLEYNVQYRVITAAGRILAPVTQPAGLSALAAHPGGGVVMANANAHNVTRVSQPTDTVRAVAGAVHYGGDGGKAVDALLDFPRALAADAAGNIYVSDSANRRVRRVTPTGMIETYVGTGKGGYQDGTLTAKSINLEAPFGLAIDPKGTLYVADYGASRIFSVAPNGGAVVTVAGTGESGGFTAWAGGPALTTAVSTPMGLTRAANGTLYTGSLRGIKRVTPAGNLEVPTADGWMAAQVRSISGFRNVSALAADSAGNVALSDDNQFDRVLSDGKTVWNIVNLGNMGFAGGIAADAKDNLYFSFSLLNYIGRRAPDGTLSRYLGGGSEKPSEVTFADRTDLRNVQAMTFLPDGHMALIVGDSVFRTLALVPSAIRITGGDGQKAWIGNPLPDPLSIKVTGISEMPIAGAKVAFKVTRGSAILARDSVTTDADGLAAAGLALGNSPGAVVVTAEVPGLFPVTFHLSAESLLYSPPADGAVPPAPERTISTAVGTVPDGEDAVAVSIRLDRPEGLAFDPSGVLFVADKANRKVRRIGPQGYVNEVAPWAGWSAPSSLALDANRTIYVLDRGAVRAVAASGEVRALPGDFPGATAISIDRMARVYVAEPEAHRVRVIFTEGTVGVFAGAGAPESAQGLTAPTQVAVADDFTIFIGDPGARTVWKVAAGVKTALVSADSGAQLDQLAALALDAGGVLYIAERGGNIYKASEGGSLTAYTTAPDDIAAMAFAPDGNLYVTSAASERVWSLGAGGTWAPAAGAPHFSGDGGPATQAGLGRPRGLSAAPDGGYYIADTDNGRIRSVDASGTITTVAGGGDRLPSADGSIVNAGEARFRPVGVTAVPEGGFYINAGSQILLTDADGGLRVLPLDGTLSADGPMAIDASGRLIVADRGNHRVIRLSADGTLETLAGNGTPEHAPDGVRAAASAIKDPRAVAIDARGLLYIACEDRIRRIEVDGTLFTVASGGSPAAMAFDGDGALYVAEPHGVRRIAPPSEPVAITGGPEAGFAGDGGPAVEGRLNSPGDVIVLPSGEILIADTLNHRIRRLR